jgi:hypothetical protein
MIPALRKLLFPPEDHSKDIPPLEPDSSNKARPVSKPGDEEILIAVMGVTGSGKSYFCRSATGYDDIEVGHGLESCMHPWTLLVKYILTASKAQSTQPHTH